MDFEKKYIDADLLIRKIKHQIRLEELNFAALGGGGQTFCINTLEWVLKQIDSLQQEQPSKDLEQAADEYQKKALKHIFDNSFIGTSKDAFIAGAQWQKEYMLSGGKTFSGLIPCWVNAPSELQPAHKYHGKNIVAMHENNGGFRCVCVDDEKPITFHLPENTLLVEGWRKQKPAEWSEEDEKMLNILISRLHTVQLLTRTDSSSMNFSFFKEIGWLNSLRNRAIWKPSEKEMNELHEALIPGHDFDCDVLQGLYADLKKLMEG